MRLISSALTVALTAAFVAFPTVSFASADAARPVSPQVVSTLISGVDQVELAASLGTAPRAGTTQTLKGPNREMADGPEVLTSKRTTARFTVAGVSWSRTSAVASSDVSVKVRVKEDSGWTAWETLAVPDEGPDAISAEAVRARVGTTPLVSSGATGIQVRVDTATGVTPPGLQVSTIDPGTSPADKSLTPTAPAGSASAAASQPPIITRVRWGIDEPAPRYHVQLDREGDHDPPHGRHKQLHARGRRGAGPGHLRVRHSWLGLE